MTLLDSLHLLLYRNYRKQSHSRYVLGSVWVRDWPSLCHRLQVIWMRPHLAEQCRFSLYHCTFLLGTASLLFLIPVMATVIETAQCVL